MGSKLCYELVRGLEEKLEILRIMKDSTVIYCFYVGGNWGPQEDDL
jgi:hypothetical protein